MAGRQTRSEKKAANRERLLRAAERIVAKEGFARVSLDRVAETAGLTKGAIYSNFTSKEDLLLEVANRLTPGLNLGERVAVAGDLPELLDHLAGRLAAASSARSKEAIIAFEFMALAVRDRKVQRLLTDDRRNAAVAGADPIEAWVAEHRADFPIEPEAFFDVLNALAWGVLLRRLVYGQDVMPDDLIRWAFRRFQAQP